ncbi:MAG: aminotransferase class V-fold PLP-dependent enzyme [Chloroflexi bacterium]|nr:aminotransferase class V-fold PLP-dependent enzyme [Chloroflexota bacterium]
MDIEHLRRDIPATQRMVYMNTGWSGPSPRPVLEAIRDYLEFENTEGPTARPVLDRRTKVRDGARAAFAGLVNATPDEIALSDNTTEGLNIVLNGLRWAPGDELVTDDFEIAAGLVPCYYARAKWGVAVNIVELDAQDSPEQFLARWDAAITPRTKLVMVSHIFYCTGMLAPVKDLIALAHARGARVLVDAAQSVGQLPVDVRDLGVDYYAFPCHKWLLGPDGVGALYIRRDLVPDLLPMKVGGRGAASYDHHGGFAPATDDIHKFEVSTTNVGLLAGATAAIAYLETVGIAHAFARSRALAARLRDGFDRIPGVTITSPHDGPLTTGLVTFRLEGVDPHQVVEALWERARIVGRAIVYPSAVRLSLDFFNTEDEVDLAVETVRQIAREGLSLRPVE